MREAESRASAVVSMPDFTRVSKHEFRKTATRADRMAVTAKSIRAQLQAADCQSSQLAGERVHEPSHDVMHEPSHDVMHEPSHDVMHEPSHDVMPAPQPASPITPVDGLRVPIGDADSGGVSGGLLCGVLHEICGICMPVRRRDGARDGAQDGAQDGPQVRGDEWIVPFGCLLHILQCIRSGGFVHRSNRKIDGSIGRMKTSVQHGTRNLSVLLERGIAWIGDKVHPHPNALRDDPGQGFFEGEPDALLTQSVFIGDASDRRAACGQRPSRLAVRSGRDEALYARVCNRVWCVEQALRLGGAGVVIVDGSGFDSMAWRRLQLAILESSKDSSLWPCSGGSCSQWGAKPLVLVVTAPCAAGGLRARGCSASTRWSIHPARGGDFCWRMTLKAMRGSAFRVHEDGRDGENEGESEGVDRTQDARSLLESGALCIDIARPRASRFAQVWADLSDRMAEVIHDESIHEGPAHCGTLAA
jgi:hypothetical protein